MRPERRCADCAKDGGLIGVGQEITDDDVI
jgi:hypothetical protein